MRFDSLFRSIKAHRWLAISIFVTTQLITLFFWLTTPQQYRATTSVLMTRTPSLVRTVMDDPKANFLLTRVALLQSRLVTDRVVARLGLGSAEVLREQWMRSPEPRMTFEDWIAAMISGGLVPGGKAGSYILAVSYIAPSPEFASALSNAYALELLEAVNALNQHNDQTAAGKTESGAKQSLRQMQEAHAQLLTLSRASGVTQEGLGNTEVKRFYGLSRLSTANMRAALEQGTIVESLREMKDVGAMLDDSYLKSRRKELATLMAAQAASLVSKGANHPDTAIIEASVLSAKREIAAYEAKRSRSLAATAQQQARSSTESLKDRDEAQAKLLESAAERMKYDRAMERFNALGDEYVENSVDAAVIGLSSDAPKSDMQIIQAATPPVEPWFPLAIYVVPISLGIGLVCMAAACAIMGARTKSVASVEDLSALVGATAIGRLKA